MIFRYFIIDISSNAILLKYQNFENSVQSETLKTCVYIGVFKINKWRLVKIWGANHKSQL